MKTYLIVSVNDPSGERWEHAIFVNHGGDHASGSGARTSGVDGHVFGGDARAVGGS